MILVGSILTAISGWLYYFYKGELTPGFFLTFLWGFIYLCQGIFFNDMYYSRYGGTMSAVFCIVFIFGELIFGRRVAYLRKSLPISEFARNLPKFESRLRIVAIIFGVLSIIFSFWYYAYLLQYAPYKSGNYQNYLLTGVRELIFLKKIQVPYHIRLAVIFAYPGVILACIYGIIYGFRWFLVLPLAGVAIFGFSQAGRAGLLMVLSQIYISIYLRLFLSYKTNVFLKFLWLSLLFAFVSGGLFLFGFMLRDGGGWHWIDYLNILKLVRPYLFGGVSAFSYYMDFWTHDLVLSYGRYTFSSLFQAIGIYTQKTGIYDQYAPISNFSEKTNIYTAYRSLIDDFGMPGAALFCFFVGLSSGYMSFGLRKGKIAYIGPLVALYSWVIFSPMVSLTYFNSFIASIVLPFLFVVVLTGDNFNK